MDDVEGSKWQRWERLNQRLASLESWAYGENGGQGAAEIIREIKESVDDMQGTVNKLHNAERQRRYEWRGVRKTILIAAAILALLGGGGFITLYRMIQGLAP